MTDSTTPNSELRLQLLEQKYLTLTMKTDALLETASAMSQAIRETMSEQRAMKVLIGMKVFNLTCEDPNCECKKKTNNGEQNTTTNADSKESTSETTKDNAQTNESSSGAKIE